MLTTCSTVLDRGRVATSPRQTRRPTIACGPVAVTLLVGATTSIGTSLPDTLKPTILLKRARCSIVHTEDAEVRVPMDSSAKTTSAIIVKECTSRIYLSQWEGRGRSFADLHDLRIIGRALHLSAGLLRRTTSGIGVRQAINNGDTIGCKIRDGTYRTGNPRK